MNRISKVSAAAGTLLAMSFIAPGANAEALEEVVAHGSRASIVAEQARFEAAMNAFTSSVDAALRSEIRERIAEQARPPLRVAQTLVSHRG